MNTCGRKHVDSSGHLGGIASLSSFAVPGILSAPAPPQILAKQWETLFNRGKSTMPIVAIASLLGYAYLAYRQKSSGLGWKRYAMAGALTIAIVPYTLIFMGPTNSSLLQAASGATTLSDDATHSLMLTWKSLNMGRSMLPLAGALLGLCTLVAP